ncbi:MAG: DNA mismatch repair endonuclease MutL [Phycisphaerales bacterium]
MPAPAETTRRPIKPLPALLVDQIAAGEVVERPASVVKELLDNAIDAGATRIRVDLEAGGVELIRVGDDGSGIPAEELPLAVAPHATSKIAASTDLDRIQTMGFRGEALASIASVSRLRIRSRAAGEEGASLLEVEGGAASPVRPEAGPVGTVVTVRNLFFNTPARRKFLRTAQTEQGHCAEIVRSLAAAHAHIGFTLESDGRTLVDVPPGQSVRERAVAILGAELDAKLLEVHADAFDDARGLALWGLVGLPEVARPTNKHQRIFVNGRPVRDRTIQHALQEAYRGLIEPSRKPTALLLIEMTPEGVDVNVHPTKAEVRFRDQGLVHSVVHRAVREALRGADLTPSVRFRQARPESTDFGHGLAPASGGDFAQSFQRSAPSPEQRLDFGAVRDGVRQERYATSPEAPASSATPDLPTARPVDRILQVHNSYLVTQDEQGVVIIDQHALHERVMFELLLERIASGPLESQRLLSPAVVRTTRARLDRLDDLRPLLERLGVEAEPIGPEDLAVHAFPTFLFDKRVEPEEFLADLLEKTDERGFTGDSEDALRDALDMMACKAAVKAGDRLGDEELDALLRMRERVDRSSNCPHGRPTTVRLSIRELERLFGRS